MRLVVRLLIAVALLAIVMVIAFFILRPKGFPGIGGDGESDVAADREGRVPRARR